MDVDPRRIASSVLDVILSFKRPFCDDYPDVYGEDVILLHPVENPWS